MAVSAGFATGKKSEKSIGIWQFLCCKRVLKYLFLASCLLFLYGFSFFEVNAQTCQQGTGCKVNSPDCDVGGTCIGYQAEQCTGGLPICKTLTNQADCETARCTRQPEQMGSCDCPCGNGAPDPGEECDDGNQSNADLCNNRCFFTSCGDGILQTPNGEGITEQCDDGGNAAADGCDADCAFEIPYCTFRFHPNLGIASGSSITGYFIIVMGSTAEELDWGNGIIIENPTSSGTTIYSGAGEYTATVTVANILSGGITATCSDTIQVYRDGSCGTAFGSGYYLPDAPLTGDLCAQGTTSGFVYNNLLHKWTRACIGVNSGATVECDAEELYCGDTLTNGGEECDGGVGCTLSCQWEDPDCDLVSVEWTPASPYSGQTLTGTFSTTQTGVRFSGGNQDVFITQGGINTGTVIIVTTGGTAECSRTVTGGYCGDGLVNGTEVCDGGVGCTTSCEREDPDCDMVSVGWTPASPYSGQMATGTFSTSQTGARFSGGNQDVFLAQGGINTGTVTVATSGGTIECSRTVMGGYCSDGTTNGPEECDDGNYATGDGCSDSCLFDTCLTGPCDLCAYLPQLPIYIILYDEYQVEILWNNGPDIDANSLEYPKATTQGNTLADARLPTGAVLSGYTFTSFDGSGVAIDRQYFSTGDAQFYVLDPGSTGGRLYTYYGDNATYFSFIVNYAGNEYEYIFSGSYDVDLGTEYMASCNTVMLCGNGAVEGSEECDDGNTTNNDGCDSMCQWGEPDCSYVSVEWSPVTPYSGQTLTGTFSTTQTGAQFSGGNVVVLTAQGGINTGTVTIATSGGTIQCSRTVTGAYCGDGITNGSEDCDGNPGCESVCQRAAPDCSYVSASRNPASPYSGQTLTGTFSTTQSGAIFSGSNIVVMSALGGTNTGTVTIVITGEALNCSLTITGGYCGDGTTQGAYAETCDDGNTSNGDGCDEFCLLEDAVDGECDLSTLLQTFYSPADQPSNHTLCSGGVSTGYAYLAGTGWSWDCEGLSGGTTMSCSAQESRCGDSIRGTGIGYVDQEECDGVANCASCACDAGYFANGSGLCYEAVVCSQVKTDIEGFDEGLRCETLFTPSTGQYYIFTGILFDGTVLTYSGSSDFWSYAAIGVSGALDLWQYSCSLSETTTTCASAENNGTIRCGSGDLKTYVLFNPDQYFGLTGFRCDEIGTDAPITDFPEEMNDLTIQLSGTQYKVDWSCEVTYPDTSTGAAACGLFLNLQRCVL